jgi:primosomal protein N' (replication factor Y)
MEPDTAYIEVAIALPVYQTFTYQVPESFRDFITTGKRILAPFGRRRVTGYVFGRNRALDTKEVKPILDILDEHALFPASMVPFFNWIADYYKYPIGEVVKTALPGGLNVYEYSMLTITDEGCRVYERKQPPPVAQKVLEQLLTGSCRMSTILKNTNQKVSGSMLLEFERNGWITRKLELKGGITKAKFERHVRLNDMDLPTDRLSKPRRRILELLATRGDMPLKRLKEMVPTASALIRSLESAGYVAIEHRRVYRDPFGESIKPDVAPQLNREQHLAVARACEYLEKGYHPFLLNGITGSGKTEVYLRVAAEAMKKGRSILVLVPEIALITQIERRFRARFGDCVSVLHSGLSAGERYDQWSRIQQGKPAITIGARSAIFAPYDNLGAIIVDEEHDASYKQEGKLRYNARDLAVVRAKQHNCIAILGSATPSIQSYYNVNIRKFTELILTKRVEQRRLPEIRIVDLRQTRDARGIRRFITPELSSAITKTLDRGEQILLFLNRRGYASFPVCGACGQPMRCKNCDISLTLHRRSNAYRCHYCGYSRSASSHCDICGSSRIKRLGLGTEKLEDMLKSGFGQARIARMDRDTTVRKGSIVKLLRGLKDRTIDILVGTQMVAKGHDFPNITLVGIICADLSLSFPDFRAGNYWPRLPAGPVAVTDPAG